jgi:hypothetical protein
LLTNIVCEELPVTSTPEIAELMESGTPLTFIAKGIAGQRAITFSDEGFLNAAGRKLTLAPYSRSDKRQIFSFRFDSCVGALASHQQYGMVLDVAGWEDAGRRPVYTFMFHGQTNQQFTYSEKRLRSVAYGEYVTFDVQTGECFLADAIESRQFVQQFGIIDREMSYP